MGDVTSDLEVEACLHRIQDDGEEGNIYGIINNAGMVKGAICDWTDVKTYELVMNVNFFGCVRVNKIFLPYIIRNKGRIINVTSMAGLMPGIAGLSTYSASKHAAEAYTQSLRAELADLDVKVITINPSFHKTPIVDNTLNTIMGAWNAIPSDQKSAYGIEYLKNLKINCDGFVNYNPFDPIHVVDKMVLALTVANPKTRYLVGWDTYYTMTPLLALPIPLQEAIQKFYIEWFNPLIPDFFDKDKKKIDSVVKETDIKPVLDPYRSEDSKLE